MSILSNHFYHETISLYMMAFGAVFDEIKIRRDDDRLIEVPVSWAAGKDYNIRLKQGADPGEVRFNQRLPRISYRLTGLQRDSVRVKNKLHKIKSINPDTDQVDTQYMRVPFNFDIEMDIKVEYYTDLLQILEQIYVYFNPSLQFTIIDNPDLQGDTALTLTLVDGGIDESFEGAFEDQRHIQSNMNFKLEGFLYMPTHKSHMITNIILNYRDLTPDNRLGDIYETDIVTDDS